MPKVPSPAPSAAPAGLEEQDRQTKESVYGEFGCVHISVLLKLQRMSYRDARKYLKDVWFTKSEQDALLHLTKELASYIRELEPARK